MNSMIHVGTSKETTEVIKFAILQILNTSAGDAVKQTAIETMGKLGEVNNTNISNCNFTGGTDAHDKEEKSQDRRRQSRQKKSR